MNVIPPLLELTGSDFTAIAQMVMSPLLGLTGSQTMH